MTFIHRYEWIAYGLLAIAAVVASLPPFPYGWHLFLHIAGAVIRADFLFTLPGVLLVLINGLIMAYARWGGAFRDFDWISVAVALFVISGIIWVGALLRLQHRMVVLSARPAEADSLPPEFYSALHKWYFWGLVAILLPLGSLYLMVAKPSFG